MRRTGIILAAVALMMGSANAIELDPKIVGFKLPADIKWNDNTHSGNRSAVLQGDPSPAPTRCCLPGCPAT